MNIRLSAPFRLILAALLVLSLQACATRGTEIGTSAPSDASNAAWQAYQGYASARASDHDPYRLSGSLRYGSQGDTRRVETLLWSNGYLPIRLDVMAGIGALVARIQETQDSFTAYAPNENKAIVHKGPQRVQDHRHPAQGHQLLIPAHAAGNARRRNHRRHQGLSFHCQNASSFAKSKERRQPVSALSPFV